MLAAAAGIVEARHRPLVRLDCVEGNARLRQYYRQLGFTEVGRRAFEDRRWHPVVLLERPIAGWPAEMDR